jgi:hypothetical protein
MQQETDNAEPQETEAKPTITIAERDGDGSESETEAKPTITIAERDGGE